MTWLGTKLPLVPCQDGHNAGNKLLFIATGNIVFEEIIIIEEAQRLF